ncbi:hypothetical protein ART_4296 [Arthrobacter sp. PAMC 25486]|nr:hypothetical protein ART_4296 [Arthrobacter sp. PAMC 25486]
MQRILVACAAAGVVAACSFFAVPAQAEDGPPSGFPSWSDVEKTKNDAAAAAAQVGNISQLLDMLDNEAGVLGDAAVQAGADYATTQQTLDAVTAQVTILNAQAQRADEQAQQYTREAVAVAVQSYKNGGANFGVIATIADLESAKNLNGVDLLQKIGERSAIKAARASESQAAATELQKTRESALVVHKELTAQAVTARDAAVAAQSALNRQIETQQEQSSTLVAQLAFLKGTSDAQEREYRQGQTALAHYEQVQDAKRKADDAARRAVEAENNTPKHQSLPESKPFPDPVPAPSPKPVPAPKPVPEAAPQPAPEPIVPEPPVVTPPGGSGALEPNLPGGAVNDPAGAKAYAAGSLGSFGWGQDQFQCLDNLWERESNWRTNATNPSSGAYGIAQALQPSRYGDVGNDWLTNYRTQVTWGLGYIQGRYGSPCGAWDHSQTIGWY